MIYCFTDPLVVADAGWADTIPKWMRDEVPLERMARLAGTLKGGSEDDEYATDIEAAIYLYTASLAAPLDRQRTDIYLYLCTKYEKRLGKQVPNDIRKGEISDYDKRELDELKDWIYRQQVKARKRLTSKRKEEDIGPQYEQGSLFDE